MCSGAKVGKVCKAEPRVLKKSFFYRTRAKVGKDVGGGGQHSNQKVGDGQSRVMKSVALIDSTIIKSVRVVLTDWRSWRVGSSNTALALDTHVVLNDQVECKDKDKAETTQLKNRRRESICLVEI